MTNTDINLLTQDYRTDPRTRRQQTPAERIKALERYLEECAHFSASKEYQKRMAEYDELMRDAAAYAAESIVRLMNGNAPNTSVTDLESRCIGTPAGTCDKPAEMHTPIGSMCRACFVGVYGSDAWEPYELLSDETR